MSRPSANCCWGSIIVIGEPAGAWAKRASTCPRTCSHSLFECGTPMPWRAAVACAGGRPGVNLMCFQTLVGVATTTTGATYVVPSTTRTRTCPPDSLISVTGDFRRMSAFDSLSMALSRAPMPPAGFSLIERKLS